MAKLLTDLFYTGFDLNGVPLPGAKLEFFITGTSTPLAVFTDNALTVAHTNPVIADSAGRFAPIYMQSADYKAILSTSADVVIDTIDPVHGAEPGVTDVSTRTVIPTGSVTSRTLADLFGLGALDVENVKLHGAKGDTVELTDGTVTDASTTLSSVSVTFVTADAGKEIAVEGAATTGVTITGAANAAIDAAFQFDASGVDAAAFVDLTTDLNDVGAGDVLPFPATEAVGDRFYMGHVQTFSSVAITIGTSGTVGTVTWKYWNGTIWANLTTTDNTVGFTAAPGTQTVSFTPPGDWASLQLETAFDGRKLFYIAAEVATVYTVNPILSQGVLSGGRIRLTATAHGLKPNQTVSIKNIVGTTEANGTFIIERNGLDSFDLIGSTFANIYTSGGTAHGRLTTTIASVSGGNAVLTAAAGASVTSTAKFRYGTDDSAAIQTAVDTNNTVVFPDGIYISDQITIATAGQRLIGLGGEIITKSATMSQLSLIQVNAERVTLHGLKLWNPDEQGATTGERNYGIEIKSNFVRVENCTVRRFQQGIVVRADGEYYSNIITGNHVLENIGAGSGDDLGVAVGEDRGDGITNWGATAIITNNLVTVAPGNDCRIGIHSEGLLGSHAVGTFVYEEMGTVIEGNIVLGNTDIAKNGRWRRGIVCENVPGTMIKGNFVTGTVQWGIVVSGHDSMSGYQIEGNEILFERPAHDISGDNFAPKYSAINVIANGSVGLNNIVVANNNIKVTGTGRGLSTNPNVAGQKATNIRFTGNSIKNVGGSMPQMASVPEMTEFIFNDNIFDGPVTGTVSVSISIAINGHVKGNKVIGVPAAADCLTISANAASEYMIVTGNHTFGGDDGISVINQLVGPVVTENVILDPVGPAIQMSGSDNGIVAHNVTRTAGTDIASWTPSATKLLDNNLAI